MCDPRHSPASSNPNPYPLGVPLSITTPDHLPAHICPEPLQVTSAAQEFGMRITPHYLNLIERPDDALAIQVIPDPRELQDTFTEDDPLSEEAQSPAPQIIHRYPRRVIFLVTNQCAVHCRFCMRKRRVSAAGPISTKAIDAGLNYIKDHVEINEVILSGGDPFMLADAALCRVLGALYKIPHILMLRLHTRIPSVWPQRITPALAQSLSAFHPLYVNIHFNHPREITPQATEACNSLADAGIPLGSQTVLLKGVNDDADTLMALFEKLLAIRVRPYYLHLLDRVPGTAHFQVPIHKSLAIAQRLRGHLSGIGMPHLMVDLPGGGGKVELLPETQLRLGEDHLEIKNYQGQKYCWPLK